MNPYNIIRHPFVTEKTMNLLEDNKLEFIVVRWADRTTVKRAVEELLGAKVVKVNTFHDKEGKHAIVKFSKDTKVEDLATRIGVF